MSCVLNPCAKSPCGINADCSANGNHFINIFISKYFLRSNIKNDAKYNIISKKMDKCRLYYKFNKKINKKTAEIIKCLTMKKKYNVACNVY